MKMEIVDIFWDRIYLNIIIKGILNKKIYLASNSEKIELKPIKVNNEKWKIVINITNVSKSNMLKNDTYRFVIKNGDKLESIAISTEVGYKLEGLDRIFRYKNKNFAYTINLENKYLEENGLTCVLNSRFMITNKNYYKNQGENNKKSLITMYMQNCINTIYKIFSIINNRKSNNILLMSETRAPIGGNLKALDDRLKEREIDKKYKISYSFFKTLEQSKVKLIVKWLKLVWLISKQKLIFIDDYSPIFKFIDLDKKTKLIQLWHAGVGFKSVGYARFGFDGPEPYNSCHRKYDYAIVGAESLIPVYQEVFGIDKDKILPYGLPRLDNFLDKNHIDRIKEKIYNKYPNLLNKKIILFAPTFRGSGQRKAYYPYNRINLNEIFSLCQKENYIFVVKMHPFIKEKINIPKEYQNYIIDLSNYNDINELFYITDILITDYSSNIYDFSLLNKPILFYTFDLDVYQLTNKVHRPIREYAPGKICMNFEELINAIYEKDFEKEKLNKFREENFSIKDKKSADLIIDNIILKNNEND